MFRIPKQMQAVVYRGANDLRVETLPVPKIGAHEMLVKVFACGVCPTDIKKIQYATVPPPRIFGHETAGVVVAVGARMKKFRIGDRVALHHHVPCLDCHACRHHAFAQCEQYKKTGITAGFEPAGGGYSEYARVMPFVMPGVIRIPKQNSFLEGAMLEPVNTVLKAVKRLSLLKGDRVLVAGQGPIGLMFTRLLMLRGMRVVATDLLETRLRMAREFGATETWVVQSPTSKVQTQETKTKPSGSSLRVSAPSAPFAVKFWARARPSTFNPQPAFDAAIIAVPSDDVVRKAQERVRGGGQILLFSHTRRGVESPIDLAKICVDEKDLIGSYSADFELQEEVARLVFSRKLDVRRLITHQFPLAQTAQAVELAAHPTPDSLKVVVAQDKSGDE